MRKALFLILMFLISLPVSALAFEPAVELKLGDGAFERGKSVYMAHCAACHGLKYYRDESNPAGIPPAMDPKSAEAAFGVAPPDLSLMASARGKGLEGPEYVYRLLTTYYTGKDGQIKNRAFAEETQGDGTIAMPPPISLDDPELKQKANDVSVFLFKVSEPSLEDRSSIGPWVIGYMAILTALLYALNRVTWATVKKKQSTAKGR